MALSSLDDSRIERYNPFYEMDLALKFHIERYNPSYEQLLNFFIEFDRARDLDDKYSSRNFSIEKNDSIFLALDDYKDILGYIKGRDCRFGGCLGNNVKTNSNYAQLIDLYVLPDYRKMGIGTSLIQALRQDFSKKGIEDILAYPTFELHQSEFYEKEGLLEEEIFRRNRA